MKKKKEKKTSKMLTLDEYFGLCLQFRTEFFATDLNRRVSSSDGMTAKNHRAEVVNPKDVADLCDIFTNTALVTHMNENKTEIVFILALLQKFFFSCLQVFLKYRKSVLNYLINRHITAQMFDIALLKMT